MVLLCEMRGLIFCFQIDFSTCKTLCSPCQAPRNRRFLRPSRLATPSPLPTNRCAAMPLLTLRLPLGVEQSADHSPLRRADHRGRWKVRRNESTLRSCHTLNVNTEIRKVRETVKGAGTGLRLATPSPPKHQPTKNANEPLGLPPGLPPESRAREQH